MSTTELAKRSKELSHQEAIIEEFQKSFQFAGTALRTIRDHRLYQDKFDTFEAYCKARWGFSRPRAYQLIGAVEVCDNLSTIVDTSAKDAKPVLPQNESQARALASCADDATQQHQVWSAAIEKAGDKPVTAKIIATVADEILPPKVKTKPQKPEKHEEPAIISKQGSGTSEQASQFDPDVIEGTKQPATDDVLKKSITERAVQVAYDLDAALKSVERLMNDVDKWHAHNQMSNIRAFTASYQRLHTELTQAGEAMVQVERAWKAGAK